MAQFNINNNNYENTIVITKKTGTTLTLNTQNKFVDKNIKITNNVQEANISTTANASATISNVSYQYYNESFLVNGSANISGKATATVVQKGWVESSFDTIITGTASLSGVSIPKVGINAALSGATSARKPSISKQDTPSGVTNAASGAATTSAPTSGVYVAVKSEANTATITATPAVASAGYGTTVSGQYTASTTSTTVGAAASDITYIPISPGSAVANSASAEIGVYTVDGSNAGINISGIVGTRATSEPTNGYYLAFSVTGSGSSKVEQAGWLNAGALPTATTTVTRYFPITSGTATVAGGELTAGAGSATLTNKGYYDGSTYSSSDTVVLATSATTGYYAINASGSGKVSRGVITRSVTAGYQPASVATTVIAASNDFSSNIATATYYIKKSTLSTNSVVSSNSTTSITVYAGYYPTDRIINVTGMSNASTTTTYAQTGMGTYFTSTTAGSANVTITPQYLNSAGYLSAHTNAINNGGVGYWKIKATSATYTAGSVSGTTFTQGQAAWGTGWISGGNAGQVTFSNTATSNVTYLDISATDQAPILASGDYLYINKGYTDNVKISLARLVPDASITTAITAGHILQGYGAYNNKGELLTGSIQTRGVGNLSVNGKTVTVTAGYYPSDVSKSIAVGTITSGVGTAQFGTPSYNSTNGNFTLSATGTVAAPSVGTAGYVSSSEGTKNGNTISGSTTLAKIYLGTEKDSGDNTVAPTINRTAKPTNDTWIDAASGAATSTKPTSGVYVRVDAASATNILKIKGKVTTAGYGTTAYFDTSVDSYIVGAAAAASKYIPITTGTTTITNGTSSATATAGTASIVTAPSASSTATYSTSGISEGISSASTSYSITISSSATANSGVVKATGGNAGAKVTASNITVTPGYNTTTATASTLASDTGNKTGSTTQTTAATSNSTTSTTVYLKSAVATMSGSKGAAPPTINKTDTSVTNAVNVASGNATTTTPAANTCFISVQATAPVTTITPTVSVTTKGYLNTNSQITGSVSTTATTGSIYYVPVAKANVTSTAGSASATGGSASVSVTGIKTVTTNTGYQISATATGGNASTTTSTLSIGVGYVTAGQTATVAAKSATGASSSTAVYIQKGALSASVSSNSGGSAGMSANGFTALTGTNTSGYYVLLSTTAGQVKAKANVKTEGYVISETDETAATSVSVSGNGTRLYIPTATATGSIVNYSAPTITATMAAAAAVTTTSTNTNYYITLTTTATSGSVKAKATVGSTTGIVAAGASHTSGATTIDTSINTPTTRINIPASSHTISAISGGGVSCTFNAATSCSLSTTDTLNSGISFTFKGSRAAASVSSTATAGYTPGSSKTATLAATSANSSAYYIQGVTLTKPSSGTIRKFNVTVPNGSGSDTITFQFQVDSSGNVTIASPT